MKPADGKNNRTGASPSVKYREDLNDRYSSRSAQKVLFDRMLFCVFGGILVIFLAVLYWILAVDAEYRPLLDPVEASSGEVQCESAPAVTQPDDAHYTTVITFGGTCTTASMLGSSSYGTFNLMYAENGAEYFLGQLDDVFSGDDCTVLGCSAVFSDNAELTPAEKSVFEWYRAPASASAVFSSGGVDALSLECARNSDYGEAGIADTKAAIESQGIVWGDSGRNIEISLSGGGKAVVLCCTYAEGCEADTIARIQSAAQEYDAVIMYITDRGDSYTVSDAKRAAYRSFADAGADAVIGSNGSKLQCIEEWNGKTIAYSLGALLDGSTKYPEKYAALMKVSIKVSDGSVCGINCTSLPVLTYSEGSSWQPRLLEEGVERDNVSSFLSGIRETPN